MAQQNRRGPQNEREKIRDALEAFFEYADHRRQSDQSAPREVEEAFGYIMTYYTQCLRRVLHLLPMCYRPKVERIEDLYQHGWIALWFKGQNIKKRGPAGVYQWLKAVIIHHVISESRKRRREVSAEAFIEIECIESELWFEMFEGEEAQFRFALISAFFEQALAKLNARRQELIRLVRENYSLAEIAKRLGYKSANAVSSAKRRAFERIGKHLGLLLQRALKDPQLDPRSREIIVELLERFYNRGEEPPCAIAFA